MFIVFVLVFSSLAFTATDLYLPSLPAIGEAFGASHSSVQLSVSFYLVTFSLSQLVYGPASDRFGRKPVAILGLTISLAGMLIAAWATGLGMLIGGRLVQGAGLGASSLFRPILRDVYHGTELAKISSLIAVTTSFMMAVAPILGGYIQYYLGWRFDFVFLSLWVLAALIGLLIWLPETNKHKNAQALTVQHVLHTAWMLVRNRQFLGYSGCTSMGYAGLMAYLTASPFLLQTTIGVTPVAYGWLALVVAGGLALGGFLNHRLVKRLGIDRMITGSFSMLLLTSIAMLALGTRWTTVWTLVPPMFVFSIGLGSLFPNAYAGALTPFPKIAGTAAALYGMLQVLGAFVASTVAAILPELTQRPLAWTLLTTSLLGFACERWAHSSPNTQAA